VRAKPQPGSLELELPQRAPGATYHRTTATLNLAPERVVGDELPGWVERALVAATGVGATVG
jgi:hypothetical protein